MNRWLALGLGLAFVVGLALRVPHLGQRPMHTDESVHAYKFLGLWQHGEYRYDPNEYHGPSLYYFSLPVVWASGANTPGQLTEATLRAVTVVFGLGLILLLPLLADGLGRTATWWAALFTAVSTAFVYYSRYYIHEVPLVFFTVLFGGAVWRYLQKPALGWALLAGAALGLMQATKETFVFNLAAMAVAAAGVLVFAPGRKAAGQNLLGRLRLGHILAAVALALALSVVLFSSFFTNATGPLDSLRTYLPWLQRAGGDSPHNHPWPFYFERLFWFHPAKGPVFSELLIGLLAVLGGVAAFLPDRFQPGHRGLAQFLVFYTVALTAVYTVIAYKTPWCALGFLHGLILLAGLGAAALFKWIRPTWLWVIALVVVLGATVQLAVQARRASSEFAADQRNPYVYAHTSKDLLRLVQRVDGVARVDGHPDKVGINVMAPGGDYWPLPWYFRALPDTHWSAGIPADPYAPIVVADARLHAALDDKSDKRWLSVGYYEHRPGVFFELFVELELWKRYVATLPRDRDDEDE